MAKSKSAGVSVEQVKKYAFWGVIPVLVIAVFVVTSMGVGGVAARFESRKSQLESQKKATETISQDSAHPNDKTIADINNHTQDLRTRVSDAWVTLQADQGKRSQWPDDLGTEFLERIQLKRFGDEIDLNDRDIYRNFIERALPAMEVKAQRRRLMVRDSRGGWVPADNARASTGMMESLSSRGGGGGGGAGGAMANVVNNPDEKWEGIVDWDSIEMWNVRSGWDTTRPPTSKQIWYAQEDLWVYDALISVVVTSNLGATGPHNAKIKRIEAMLIGQAASPVVSEQFNKSLTAGGEGAGGGAGAAGGAVGGGGEISSEAGRRGAVETMILDNRYIDTKGQPLLASATPPFPQFKRMPVCLRLVVDQRYIPQILVNCANCPMPIDVFFVRYNPPESQPFDLSQQIGAASLGGGGGGGDRPTSAGAGRGSASSMGGGTGSGDVGAQIDGSIGIYGPESIPIEIYGVINIFNRPDDSLMQPADNSTAASTADSEP